MIDHRWMLKSVYIFCTYCSNVIDCSWVDIDHYISSEYKKFSTAAPGAPIFGVVDVERGRAGEGESQKNIQKSIFYDMIAHYITQHLYSLNITL